MPTYEYICETCGHQFEQFQPISAQPLTICPKNLCTQKPWAKGRVKRAISGGAGLIFKGTGFYTTDYRSDNYKKAAQKDSPPPTKTETKPPHAGTKPAVAKGETGTPKSSADKT